MSYKLNWLEHLPDGSKFWLSETDREVIRLIMAWALTDPSLSTEMQGNTIGDSVRLSICRNMANDSFFVKIEEKSWSAYSKTNWWRGRAWQNNYQHPLKVLAQMLTEAFQNGETDPDETTEYTGGAG